MKKRKAIKNFTELQYKTHQNLSNRINIWSYGTNPESIYKWIFRNIKLQENERLLELGCGTGNLWLENYKSVNLNNSIIISDASKNMLNTARSKLKNLNLPLSYKKINAEKIPFPDQTFDIVLACHMMYHIPDLKKALLSINRILKLNGRFISTTVSKIHLQELNDFLSEFGLSSEKKMFFFSEYRNETARGLLEPFFTEIDFYEYKNTVNITSVDPLMKYIESMFPIEYYPNFQKIKPQIEEAVIEIIKRKSKFQFTGISGLFNAKYPIKI
jgi:ubiquinone/menaquinone biosynthesis C-methylase UbiE